MFSLCRILSEQLCVDISSSEQAEDLHVDPKTEAQLRCPSLFVVFRSIH